MLISLVVLAEVSLQKTLQITFRQVYMEEPSAGEHRGIIRDLKSWWHNFGSGLHQTYVLKSSSLALKCDITASFGSRTIQTWQTLVIFQRTETRFSSFRYCCGGWSFMWFYFYNVLQEHKQRLMFWSIPNRLTETNVSQQRRYIFP